MEPPQRWSLHLAPPPMRLQRRRLLFLALPPMRLRRRRPLRLRRSLAEQARENRVRLQRRWWKKLWPAQGHKSPERRPHELPLMPHPSRAQELACPCWNRGPVRSCRFWGSFLGITWSSSQGDRPQQSYRCS
jgi:hypothetical protein